VGTITTAHELGECSWSKAKQHNGVKRVLTRWLRFDVIALDEVGYVPFRWDRREFLFQVIAERAERAAVIVTTNLPFSEWTQVFPNPRLCKALLDLITDRAHIIETGTESYRFRRTIEGRQKKKASQHRGAGRAIFHGPAALRPKRAAQSAAQGSAPPGHGKWEKPAEMENQQLRVGQTKVSKVGEVRLSNARARESAQWVVVIARIGVNHIRSINGIIVRLRCYRALALLLLLFQLGAGLEEPTDCLDRSCRQMAVAHHSLAEYLLLAP
jgi:hypothetical protein